MFKKPILLAFVFIACMSVGLIGMDNDPFEFASAPSREDVVFGQGYDSSQYGRATSTVVPEIIDDGSNQDGGDTPENYDASDGDDESNYEPENDATLTDCALVSAEGVTAVIRAYLAYSIKNDKNCSNRKAVLTDLSRIVNEGLSFYNYVDKKCCEGNEEVCNAVYDFKNDYLRYVSLFWMVEDSYTLLSDFFKSNKSDKNMLEFSYEESNKNKKADSKLKSAVRLLDKKIIPLIEGFAAIARSADSIVCNSNVLDINKKCTALIILARVLSKLVNSEKSSTELKYDLFVSAIIGFVALHDYMNKTFKNIKKFGNNITGNPAGRDV